VSGEWNIHLPAFVLGLTGLAGCSTPGGGPVPIQHGHEVAVAWVTGQTTDGFHFPIACPGSEKLVLFGNARFQMTCDRLERVRATMVDATPVEPEGEQAGAPSKQAQPLKCYLVVVPDFQTVPGVLTDMRRAIAAKRAGPLDCALIRYG
jgi:hypothetical protein